MLQQLFRLFRRSPRVTPPDGNTPLLLEVHRAPAYTPVCVATDPDTAMIAATVRALSWTELTFVVLKRDTAHWLEGSGSLDPDDGFSARYCEGGTEYVAARPPASLEEIITLLQAYQTGDGSHRTRIPWK